MAMPTAQLSNRPSIIIYAGAPTEFLKFRTKFNSYEGI